MPSNTLRARASLLCPADHCSLTDAYFHYTHFLPAGNFKPVGNVSSHLAMFHASNCGLVTTDMQV